SPTTGRAARQKRTSFSRLPEFPGRTSKESPMADNSFDVVSNVDFQEVKNAIAQAEKEIANRYDLKKAAASVKLEGEEFTLESSDEFTLQQALEVAKTKLVRRNVNLKSLRPGKVEAASGGGGRPEIFLPKGISPRAAEKARST